MLTRELKIQNLRFHDLRHTAATSLRRAGVDWVTIQAICGWKSVAMVRRYQTVDRNDMRAAMATLDAAVASRRTGSASG